MGLHEVAAVQREITGHVGEEHTGETADEEVEEKRADEQHGRREARPGAPQRAQRHEVDETGGHRDRLGGEHVEGAKRRRETADEQMVLPHHEAEHGHADEAADRDAISPERAAREHRKHLHDQTEGRQDEDVDLGMAEEPEQVLPQVR